MRTYHLLAAALAFSLASVANVGAQEAQPAREARPAEGAREADDAPHAVARALDARLTIWRTPRGEVVHVRHCRDAPGGCRARLAAFARILVEAARAHDLDPFMLAAIAIRESGLDPLAEGSAGERGIVQLHPQGVGRNVRFVQNEAYRRRCARDPAACQREVVMVGAELVARSIASCGSVEAGLGMYNRGVCGETDYTRRILAEREQLLALAKRRETLEVSLMD